ncbi:MAG: tetraacyldisaccharide 4'-kinase [Deltaproteobacteria bacterium]|nr:tetraacyldisaccharide 4'-kinase [Deltaproteobacteria bacterium]
MRLYWHNLFRRLHGDRGAGPPPGPVLCTGAAVLARLYGLGASGRRALYARGLRKARRLPAPVVSVGNLTVGGAGKTPVVAFLARLWRDRGKRVAILSRGYGGRSRSVTCISDGQNTYGKPPEVGEEPYWLARTLPGVAVYTGACRYAAGMAAWEKCKPDLFLLDDGFQHFQLHRDLDLVLLDAASPFGNGHLLPRGPLREPLAALAAAQSLILTRFDRERHQAQFATIHRAFPDKPLLTATIAPLSVTAYPGGQAQAPAALRHQALMAFAGLARPEVFAATLQALGVDLKGFRIFPDHHAFSHEELDNLTETARALGAGGLVTTGKDWARLGERWDGGVRLWVLEVEARLGEPEQVLELLDRSLQEG